MDLSFLMSSKHCYHSRDNGTYRVKPQPSPIQGNLIVVPVDHLRFGRPSSCCGHAKPQSGTSHPRKTGISSISLSIRSVSPVACLLGLF
ncbi:Quinone oxidoreductase PIG3 [Fusarium oxysporum f. sp. albedinis]|nr:Quinone oxidoreductase PIG3 [Fusarium oxysporum f. sp. albedinis]